MKTTTLFASLLSALVLISSAQAAIVIDTVPVGNPANLPDTTTGFGAVAYDYQIGKTEVTNTQYTAFLNAVAATDTYGLYNTWMSNDTRGGIMQSGSSGSYTYSVKLADGAYTYGDKPVIYVSSGDAMRFANWLQNGQPSGAQGPSTTERGAYKLDGAIANAALAAVTRNSGATWFLPTENEWYKAAYHKNDGVTDHYYDYPTSTDSLPNNYLPSSDTGNSANFSDNGYTTGDQFHPLTDAGAYTLSDSPYGTFDQGGNVSEWNETLFDSDYRGYRGGSWANTSLGLHAMMQFSIPPGSESSFTGFRLASIASIPEATSLCVWSLGIAVVWMRRRGRG